MPSRTRLGSVLIGALAVSGLATAPAVTGPAHAAPSCRVDYTVASEWPGGFVANLTISNTGDRLDGWTLTWNYAAGQSVASAWNAQVTQTGSQVSARNVAHNGVLESGASTSFGFQGTWSNGNPPASGFILNGTSCDGGSQPTTTTQPTRTTATTTTSTTRPTVSTTTTSSPPTATWTTSSSQPSGNCGAGTGDAEVTANGGSYTTRRGGSVVYTGSDFAAATQTAIDRLTSGRTSMQRVVVRGNGQMAANQRIALKSFTSIEVCGTINVTGSASGDMAPIYGRGVNNIAVPYLKVTGSPNYGIFLRTVNNVHLGQIDMRLSHGLGVRVDNNASTSVYSKNITIDNVYVQVPDQGVETYGVDGLTVGTVTARNVGYSGLLLNNTINATIGRVDAENVGSGTGYAAFRMANRNGRVGGSYPTNVRVGEVIARGGGRGIFCVSESGGAVIDRVSITGTGNNAILIENCYNVTIAAVSGSVSGGGEIRLAARSDFRNNADITLQNLTVTNNTIRESPCGTGTIVRNNRLVGSTLNVCSGSDRGGNTRG